MINLLPPIEKKNLLIEKKKRIAIILCFLISFFVICLILVLFTVKIYVKSQVKVQESLFLSARDKEKQEKINNYRNKIGLINSRIIEMESYYEDRVFLINLIEKISTTFPEELYLKEISLISNVEEASKTKRGGRFILVSLKGFAPTRESLSSFRDNLEKLGESESFVDISFPPANWLKKFNIDFSISFRVNL